MAKLTVLPEQAIISGFKGKVDFYLHNGIAVARKWPKSPGHNRAPAVQETWGVFTDAATLWGQLAPEVQGYWNELAAGSDLTGKDLFTRAYITGIIYE